MFRQLGNDLFEISVVASYLAILTITEYTWPDVPGSVGGCT